MKHYTVAAKCAYVMSTFFGGAIGSRHHPSLRYIGKAIAEPQAIINRLVSEGYLSILQKGKFLEGTTIYRVERLYPEVDFTDLAAEVEAKLNRKRLKILNADGIRVDIGDESDKQQIGLAQAINSDSVIVKQSPNGTVWTAFCNLKKEHRAKLTYGSERIVEIDINASVPRLLITFFKNRTKEWLPEFADPINADLDSYEKAILSESDAYIGIRNALGLDMSRADLKSALLPVIFGAGTKDEIKRELTDAMMATWPNMYSQLKRYSDRYRFRTKAPKASWSNTTFAHMIFALQAQIINKALSQISGPKLSVYDCICIPESSASLAKLALADAWDKVTGDTALLTVKIDGLVASGSDLRSAQATITLVPTDTKTPHIEAGGERVSTLGRLSSKSDSKSDSKMINPKTWTDGRYEYWRAIVRGKRFTARKDSMTEEQFREYVTEKIKAKTQSSSGALATEHEGKSSVEEIAKPPKEVESMPQAVADDSRVVLEPSRGGSSYWASRFDLRTSKPQAMPSEEAKPQGKHYSGLSMLDAMLRTPIRYGRDTGSVTVPETDLEDYED